VIEPPVGAARFFQFGDQRLHRAWIALHRAQNVEADDVA
jgi:hypothetical protein